jgi:hypothetical protein
LIEDGWLAIEAVSGTGDPDHQQVQHRAGLLRHPFQLSRSAATRWLASTFGSVRLKTSIDIAARFL